jgi:hypothetical protein
MYVNKMYGSNLRHKFQVKVKVKVTLRPTVIRLVRLGIRHPSETRDQFFPFSLWLFFWQFWVCLCGVPSLTRSQICTFQFFPGIASADVLRSESHGTHDHSLLSLFLRLPPPGGPGSCICLPQEQGSPITPSGIGSNFWISYYGFLAALFLGHRVHVLTLPGTAYAIQDTLFPHCLLTFFFLSQC